MSKKKWSADNAADACSCQTQKAWMWQSITNTIIPCNTWKSRSDVLVKDKLSLVLQHPFTFGWVQAPLGHMRNQEWSPDKWFLLLKRGAKPSAVLFLSCKASSDVSGPLNPCNGMCLQEWLCTQMFFPDPSHCSSTGSCVMEGWDISRQWTFLLMRSEIFISESLAIFE